MLPEHSCASARCAAVGVPEGFPLSTERHSVKQPTCWARAEGRLSPSRLRAPAGAALCGRPFRAEQPPAPQPLAPRCFPPCASRALQLRLVAAACTPCPKMPPLLSMPQSAGGYRGAEPGSPVTACRIFKADAFNFITSSAKLRTLILFFFFLLSFSCSVPNTARAAALASSAAAAHDAVRSSAGSWRSPQRPPGGRAERGHGALRARAARRGAALPLARSSEGPSAPPRAEPEERPRHRERPRRTPPAPPEGAADIRRVGRAGGGISCAGGQPRPGPRCCRPAPLCPRPPGRSSRLGLTQ